MNATRRIARECKAIINAINHIKLTDYNQLGYNLTKWELTIELDAGTFKPINYSRIHFFNTVLSPTVNKWVFIYLGLFTEEQFDDSVDVPNLKGYICLKYPMSEIPQLI